MNDIYPPLKKLIDKTGITTELFRKYALGENSLVSVFENIALNINTKPDNIYTLLQMRAHMLTPHKILKQLKESRYSYTIKLSDINYNLEQNARTLLEIIGIINDNIKDINSRKNLNIPEITYKITENDIQNVLFKDIDTLKKFESMQKKMFLTPFQFNLF